MLAEKRVAGPLKWHGGKGAFQGKLAKWIISFMPPHLHYVEPYAGGLSVLLAKEPEGVSEVVNDLNGELMRFWRVIRDERMFARFQRYCEATPFSEPDWIDSLVAPQGWPAEDSDDKDVALAWCFFVKCRMSQSGRCKSFAPLTRNRTRGGMNEQASAWLTAVDGLPEVHARLRRVVVLNHDALKVIKQQDGPQALFYLDPPYLHETRSTTDEYECEMSEDDHSILMSLLATIEGRFILSGYRSDLYDKAAERHGWHREDFEIPNNSATGKIKERKIESVWMNFQPQNK